jgi:hypothetical protein
MVKASGDEESEKGWQTGTAVGDAVCCKQGMNKNGVKGWPLRQGTAVSPLRPSDINSQLQSAPHYRPIGTERRSAGRADIWHCLRSWTRVRKPGWKQEAEQTTGVSRVTNPLTSITYPRGRRPDGNPIKLPPDPAAPLSYPRPRCWKGGIETRSVTPSSGPMMTFPMNM